MTEALGFLTKEQAISVSATRAAGYRRLNVSLELEQLPGQSARGVTRRPALQSNVPRNQGCGAQRSARYPSARRSQQIPAMQWLLDLRLDGRLAIRCKKVAHPESRVGRINY